MDSPAEPEDGAHCDQHLDSGLLGSRTVQEQISLFQTTQFVVTCSVTPTGTLECSPGPACTPFHQRAEWGQKQEASSGF